MTKHTETETILIGDDLDEGGAEALAEGRDLAHRRGARIAVCHAIPDPGPIEALLGTLDDVSARQIDHLKERSRLALRSRVDRILGKDEAATTVAVGSAHSVLLAEQKRLGASCIVVGASSRSGAEKLLLGESAALIVRHAPCAVLVARRHGDGGPVLAATDLSDPAVDALARAVEEARAREAELVACHVLDLAHPLLSSIEPAVVIDEGTAARLRETTHATLEAAIARVGGDVRSRTEVVEGPPRRVLPELARRLGAALIVVGTRGRTGFSRIALGSVAETVVRKAPCSVLVVR